MLSFSYWVWPGAANERRRARCMLVESGELFVNDCRFERCVLFRFDFIGRDGEK